MAGPKLAPIDLQTHLKQAMAYEHPAMGLGCEKCRRFDPIYQTCAILGPSGLGVIQVMGDGGCAKWEGRHGHV